MLIIGGTNSQTDYLIARQIKTNKMKKISLIVLMTTAISAVHAQSSLLDKTPISIGYYGHYFLHPGIKIGAQYDWKTWETQKQRKKKTVVKTKSLFVSPQVGFYVHPKNHSGLLINADIGYQRIKQRRGFYTAYSLGLGYLTQFNAGATYVAEDDGSITAKKFASRAYFMPTLNAEFGQKINPKIGWFSKFSVGSKLFYNTGVSAEVFMEMGVKIKLSN